MTSVCCGHLHWTAWHGINCHKYEARCKVRCSDAVLTQDKMQCVLHLPLSIMPRVTLSPTLNLNALQTLLTRDPCYHLISGDSHWYWLLGAVHKWRRHFLGSLAPLGGCQPVVIFWPTPWCFKLTTLFVNSSEPKTKKSAQSTIHLPQKESGWA